MTVAQNPLIWACVIGLVVNVTHLPLPKVWHDVAEALGRSSLGIGLLVTGAGLHLEGLFRPSLAASIAVTVTVVITVLTIVATRLAERQLNLDLRETARVAAVALSDDIELRQDPWNAEALAPLLRDFMNAGSDLRYIAVFRADGEVAVPVTSTSLVAMYHAGFQRGSLPQRSTGQPRRSTVSSNQLA